MLTEAVGAGFYRSVGWDWGYPKIQILMIAELLCGVEVKMPPAPGTFKTAARVQADPALDQFPLDFLD